MFSKRKPVRIGVDIRDLRVAKTGQKTVTEELCKQFAAMKDPGLEFIFIDSDSSIYTGTNKWRIIAEHIRYQGWKQIVLPWKAWRSNCDIVFCGDYFAPLIRPGFKTVEIFYDAFFFEYSEHYPRLWLKLFHAIAMPAAKKCSKIITITEYSRHRLNQLAGFPLDKIITAYPSYKTSSIPDIPTSKSPVKPGRKYLLHVGVMEKRKNLPSLIKAFHQFTQKGYDDTDLVLVGQGNGKRFSDDTEAIFQMIKACGLEERVVLTGYLKDEEVTEMYQNAFMYVFPSINEGFGIPILEAFRFGVPVIVANNSCLPEVGGDAVLSFDPFDTKDICDKMQQVADNEQLRRDLIARGTERLGFFTWEKAAAQIVSVFKDVSRR